MTAVTSLSAVAGTGRDDIGDAPWLQDMDSIREVMSSFDASSYFTDIAVSLDHWDTYLKPSLTQCAAKTASTDTYTLTNPVFETENALYYEIGSGLHSVALTNDWAVQGNMCSIDFQYKSMEPSGLFGLNAPF